MKQRELIASWLFTIGSGLFVIDAMTEITEGLSQGLSLIPVMHLFEGILFLVGSVFLMPSTSKSASKKTTQS